MSSRLTRISRARSLLLASFTTVLACAAATAQAAPVTVTDPDDPFEQSMSGGFGRSFDVRSVTFDATSAPGTVKLRLELDFAPGAAIDGNVFFDTDRDGKADYAIELSETLINGGIGSRHPQLDGTPGTVHYVLRRVQFSTNDCQSFDDEPTGGDVNTMVPATRRLVGTEARTDIAIDIPAASIGDPASFVWAVNGRSNQAGPTDGFGGRYFYDFVPDASIGVTDFEGRPIDPRDPPFTEGADDYCGVGVFGNGRKVRMTQGTTFVARDTPPPTVSIDQTPATGRPGDTVSFIANVADGRPVASYAWDLDRDGEFDDATGRTASRRFDRGGLQFVAVRVTDNAGRVGTAEKSVDIADRAPVADIAQSPALARPNRAVTLTANATDDGRIVGYAWDLDADGDFDDDRGPQITRSFATEGTFSVAVQVTDDAGNATVARRSIEVAERAPTMTVATSNARPIARERFTVTADVLDDAPVDESRIEWGFELNPGDADPYNAFKGRAWTLSFGFPGTYTMKARYEDDSGKAVRQTVSVEVPNRPPTFRLFRIRKKLATDQPFNTEPLVKGEAITFEVGFDNDDAIPPTVEWDFNNDGVFDDAAGQRVDRAFPTAGEKIVRVRVTDSAGQSFVEQTSVVLRETATSECDGRVEVDGMRAVGCFRTLGGKRTTTEPFKINGLTVVPDTVRKTVVEINPLSGLVDTGDGWVTIKAGDVVLFQGRWKMDPKCDRTKVDCLAFTANVPATSKLKGFPVKGEASVFFTPKGTRVRVYADVFGQLGFGVTVATDLTVLDAGGLQLDDLEIRSPVIPLPKNLEIGQFFIKYEGARKRWSGGGSIVIPTPQFTKLSGDFAFNEVFGFERARGEIDGLNVPIDPFGTVFLQRIAFTMEFKLAGNETRIRLGGGVGMSFGPRVGGLDAMTIDGDFLFTFGWPLGLDVEGRMSVAGYDIIGATLGARTNGTVYGSGTIGLGLPFPKGQKGVRKDGTKLKVSKFDPNADVFNPFQIITIRGTVAGWAEPNAFNLEAQVGAKVIGITLAGAKALLSSKGVAGCGEVIGIKGGFGYEWVSEKTDVFGDSCDLGPWAAVRTLEPLDGEGTARTPFAAAARATVAQPASAAPAVSDVSEVEVAKGQKALMLKLRGTGGDPVVRITGPGGARSYAVPAGDEPVQDGDVVIAKNPQADETYLGVKAPAAGRWRIERLPGSPAIAAVEGAKVLPEPQVRATVIGRGPKRTIGYSVRPIPGQTVEFAEVGKEVRKVVARVSNASGRVTFTPMQGRAPRKLTAVVIQGGLPRATFDVARFTAPKPARPARARGLKAKRLPNGRIAVTWKRVPGAIRYRVVARSASGQTAYVPTTRPSAILPALSARRLLRIDVRAVGTNMLSSRAQRACIFPGLKSSGATLGLLPRREVRRRC